jgi:hypothetical protein
MIPEPQPSILVNAKPEYVEIAIVSGMPGPAGPPGPPGDGDGVMAAIVSEVAPPAQAVEGVLWVQPSGQKAGVSSVFTGANPITVEAPIITTQSSGQPIGLSQDGSQIFRPTIIGAVPVVIDGRRYLFPVIEE